MSRVLPILFNTDMVWAILEGKKTVTRRILKEQPPAGIKAKKADGISFFWAFWEDGDKHWLKCPYDVGDILYVRETWYKGKNCVLYKANNPNLTGYRDMDGEDIVVKWKPSIHMPKEAARIFLRVTDVRMERLRDITEEQAQKEGFEGEPCSCVNRGLYSCTDCMGTGWIEPPWVGFMYTWDSTIKKSEFERCEKPEEVQNG